ncbi:hypothetical protein M5K25_002364 [Dendrobium thyrsiflorum]|uniref:Uncharacterized protein n=1 Tax=Dendrobium thyrsiflorum TaxID=117978 RepID=A0ABD0W870_DENTH
MVTRPALLNRHSKLFVNSRHLNKILSYKLNKQLQRQMHPQMNMLHPQNIAFQQQQQQQQQQWDKLRRQQVSTPRSMMIMDKDQPMADVKIENIMEGPIDTNTFNALSKQQMQLRQQQMAMANHPTQSGQHFKQLQSIQIPQLQAQLAQNAFTMRTAPVKVEAFHELMGGDSTLKHEPDQNKLTSPPNYALCNFDLHIHCADASPNSTALRHSFYPECFFQFLPYLPRDSPRCCNATTFAAKISTALSTTVASAGMTSTPTVLLSCMFSMLMAAFNTRQDVNALQQVWVEEKKLVL